MFFTLTKAPPDTDILFVLSLCSLALSVILPERPSSRDLGTPPIVRYLRRLRWYSRVLEIGSYLFVVVILFITFALLEPFVFQGEGQGGYLLMVIPSAIVGCYGIVLRKAGRNLDKKKWRWLLLILFIPPSLLSGLGGLILIDMILILRKLSQVEQSEIDKAMREILSPVSRGQASPPDITPDLKGISLVWKILFVFVVTVTVISIALPETTGDLLKSLYGIEALSEDTINLIKVLFYADVIIFTLFALLYRRLQLGRIRGRGNLQNYRIMSIITQMIAVSFTVLGGLLFSLGLREEMFIFGPLSVIAMLYFRPSAHDFSAQISAPQKIYRGFLISVMIVLVSMMGISISQMNSTERCRIYLMLAAGNEKRAQQVFLEMLKNSQTPYSHAIKNLGETIIHKLKSKTINKPPVEEMEFYKLAIEVEDALGLDKELALDYHNIAGTFSLLKDYQKAIEYYTRSAELYKKLNRKDRQAEETLSIAEIYHYRLKDYEKAERSYLTALEYARSAENLHAWRNALTRLEWLYQETGQTDANLSQLKMEKEMVMKRMIQKRLDALHKAQQDGDPKRHIKALNNLADTYIISGDYVSAVKYYKKALVMLDSLVIKTKSTKRKTARTLLMLASAYTHQSRYDQAEKAYQRASRIFQDIKDENGLKRVSEGLKILEMKRQKGTTEQIIRKKEKNATVGHSYDKTWSYSIHPLSTALLEVLDIFPKDNAVLRAGRDYLKIRIKYSVSESPKILIFISPSKVGRNEVYYFTDGCYGHPRGTGLVEKSIMFKEPQRLYEIAITMVDKKTRKTLKEIYYPVDVTWE